MPIPDNLLNPIPGANPSGEDLRYAPLYDKIKEARREEEESADTQARCKRGAVAGEAGDETNSQQREGDRARHFKQCDAWRVLLTNS